VPRARATHVRIILGRALAYQERKSNPHEKNGMAAGVNAVAAKVCGMACLFGRET
jgi:hypothetical protein